MAQGGNCGNCSGGIGNDMPGIGGGELKGGAVAQNSRLGPLVASVAGAGAF